MAKVTPQEYAEKWQRRLGQSGEDIRRGVTKTTVAPGAAAAAAQDRMLSGVTESVTSGRWARKVSAVPLADWQRATTEKGIPRIASGAQAAVPKMQRVAQTLLPAVDAAAAKANAMPKGTIEDSIARAGSFMRDMHAYKQSN